MSLFRIQLMALALLISGWIPAALNAEEAANKSLAQRILDESQPVKKPAEIIFRRSQPSRGAIGPLLSTPQPLTTTVVPASTQVELVPLSEERQSDPVDVTQSQLDRLRKPIRQVVVTSFRSDQPMPEDRAERVIGTESAGFIGSDAIGAILPDRYPIVMKHQPLYFEQPNLERCGNAFGCAQNAVSVAQFLAHTAILPYRICKHRDQPCVTSGGDCKTCQHIRDCRLSSCLPLDPKALATQAASVAGFTFLLL